MTWFKNSSLIAGLRLQVVPTIPPSNDDFRSENLSCSCRCRFLWQVRPQELALFRLVMMFFVPKIFLAPVDVDSCGKLGRKNSHYVPARICWKTAFYLILLP